MSGSAIRQQRPGRGVAALSSLTLLDVRAWWAQLSRLPSRPFAAEGPLVATAVLIAAFLQNYDADANTMNMDRLDRSILSSVVPS